MERLTDRESADKIRLELLSLTDQELLNFAASTWAGEDIKGKPYESTIELIKRVADDLEKQMPF